MNDEMPERTYLKMHAWALQLGTLTDTHYIREDIVVARDAEIERLKARNDLLEKGFHEIWNVGNLRTYFESEADAQNPDARYVEFSFDDSIMDVETFFRLWVEKENAN